MRRFNIFALLLFLGAMAWVFTWKTPAVVAFKTKVMNVFSPFIRTGAQVQQAVENVSQPTRDPAELAAENTRLALEVDRQRVMLEDYDRVQAENNELRQMLDFSKSHPLPLITARILTRNTATWWNTATIDRGFDDGLATDSAVRTAQGLVGKIVWVQKNTAEILLITDETCQVAVRIEGSPDEGILSGVRGVTGRSPELRITYMPREANVPVGAKVYTSGKGTVFPSGILVGTVTKFQALDDGGQAVVSPAVNFDKLKYVFVIQRGEPEHSEAKTAGEVPGPR